VISDLERLSGPNKPLTKEPPDGQEIRGLISSGQRRLEDAVGGSISLESRFDLAYNASHALSLAALRRLGYRSSNRYIVFQVLEHTLNMPPSVWRILSRCHELRNRAEYEGDLSINDRLVQDLIVATKEVLKALKEIEDV
jgi:hypothetical protein